MLMIIEFILLYILLVKIGKGGIGEGTKTVIDMMF